jgi:predicted metalloprotease with PDZ domain
MKKSIIALLLCHTIGIVQVHAQTQKNKSEEKIILQNGKPSSQVEIEIRDGNIYVDGIKVAPYALNRNLTIIKKLGKILNDNNAPDVELNLDKDIFGGDATAENKPMLGVSTEPSKQNDGAVVNSINANTPAAKAGLQAGDVINKIDKIAITNPQDLVGAISNYKPGDKVIIGFNRNGKEMSEQITLAPKENNGMGNLFGGPNSEDMMGSMQEMMKRFGDFGNGTNPFEGLEEIGSDGNTKIFGNRGVMNGIPNSNSAKLGAQVEDRADGQGVRVTKLVSNSSADKAGIQVEDIITKFGEYDIKSIDDLSEALLKVKDKKEIAINIMRTGKAKIVYVVMDKPLRKKEF